MLTYVNLCLPLLTSANLCLPLFTNVYQCKPKLTQFSLVNPSQPTYRLNQVNSGKIYIYIYIC